MSLKQLIKKKFSDEKIVTEERNKSAKAFFLLLAFLFFVSYFGLASLDDEAFYNNYIYNVLSVTFPFVYCAFVVSIVFYSYFLIKNKFFGKISNTFFTIFLIILLSIGAGLLFILLSPKELFDGVIHTTVES